MKIDISNVVTQHESKPAEIKAAKEKMPVAYLGIGILEWHGLHNPAGLDGVKADGCGRYLAAKFGGVVVPPLYYGDHRGDICELVFSPERIGCESDHTIPICENIGYDKAELKKNEARSIKKKGWKLWNDLVVHILFQLESFGFKHVVILPGHYPLFSPLDTAIKQYKKEGGKCGILIIKDPMYADDGRAGDHAAAFETSLMLALYPEMVDSYRLQRASRFRFLINMFIGKAADKPEVRTMLVNMVNSDEEKKKTQSPLFYLKLLLP
ncbi:MAG: creatininase family protein [Eubacteriales bacterium]